MLFFFITVRNWIFVDIGQTGLDIVVLLINHLAISKFLWFPVFIFLVYIFSQFKKYPFGLYVIFLS